MKSLLIEEDGVIKKFISLLPKYGLEYHAPQSKYSFRWQGHMYPTVTDKDHSVKIGLDRTDIFNRNGHVWVGDPTQPLLNGYVIQSIVTNPEQREKGKASEALKSMLQAADEAGLLFRLEPVPMKDFIGPGQKSMNTDHLINWYEKVGFKKLPLANIMIRNPKNDNNL
ncbi:MAG TPA: hypothetical protein PL028_00225 [Bacteroidales bacterium]|nr:hypothetical protein [Bacteroidales bacterium]